MTKQIITILFIMPLLILSTITTAAIQPFYPNTNITTTEIPSSFDWRNVNGINYVTPVKNQAPAPLCESYGLCVALETIVQYKVGYPFSCDLSEAHLFFYAGGSIARGGVRLTNASDYLIEHGVPDEGCFPDPHRPTDSPFQSLAGWENRTVKITSWGWVENNITAIKQALITYGPLVLVIHNYNDFLRYRKGIYTPKVTTGHGHVVALVGYNDTQRYWIIKNSAGEDWGEDGYARVSYDADTADHPFIATFYGGTGIMYLDGVYGNFKSDVPKIQITKPNIFHTYFFGFEISTLFKKGVIIQKGAPRLIGQNTVEVNASNTDNVEFYVDGKLVYTDIQPPYTWNINLTKGLRTIETVGHHNNTISKDIRDVYQLT